MKIETERLIITRFTMDMVQAVHENSLDEDNRRPYQGDQRPICRYYFDI